MIGAGGSMVGAAGAVVVARAHGDSRAVAELSKSSSTLVAASGIGTIATFSALFLAPGMSFARVTFSHPGHLIPLAPALNVSLFPHWVQLILWTGATASTGCWRRHCACLSYECPLS